ncbi:MAG: hydrogenase iron-sulfur subunit [Methanomassiliicoccales archaeon]|nr:hydrogenase iron-sulfur subunit [Methanomassiliicoccales archaeon]
MEEGREESRIGVFLCRCGNCISGAMDLEAVVDGSRSFPNVAHVQIEDFLCRQEGISRMKDAVRLFSLEKVIVGGCSPLLYLEKFRNALGEVGVSRNAVDMVNLREQCGSIHWRYPRLCTAKASDLLKMAVAKANVISPLVESCAPVLEPEICTGCGVCRDVCKTGSIRVVAAPQRRWRRVAIVNGQTCVHCGSCAAACPNGAKDMGSNLSDQIMAQIDAVSPSRLARDFFTPRILVFVCSWCTYFTADLAGVMKLEIPPHFLSIKVPCCSEVDSEWILKAFARGIDGILIVAGTENACRHEHGYNRSRKRFALVNTMLMRLGFGGKRLKVCWIDPNQAEEYVKEVSGFVQLIMRLGPGPLRMRLREFDEADQAEQFGQGSAEPAEEGQSGSEPATAIPFEGAP